MKRTLARFALLLLSHGTPLSAGERHHYQTDFPPEEFTSRRARIFDAIGDRAMALVQGAAPIPGVSVFRQSNNFYYITGIESPHAYVLLDGRHRTATLYLAHRDAEKERNQGKMLSAEDVDLVRTLTAIDAVKGADRLAFDLSDAGLLRGPAPDLFLESGPMENGNDSRDELLDKRAAMASDPWRSEVTSETELARLVNSRFPQFRIRDLSPIFDELRTIKSQREIALIREATRIAGLGLIEAMRSTAPGVYEYQLGAAAKYLFALHGAFGDAYPAIVGGGSNAYYGHYFQKSDRLVDGDLVLMDYAPDYRYYSSDVTRIWPVNGKFDAEQAALYAFVVAYRDALFRHIRPGVTSDEVLDRAAKDMREYLREKPFAKAAHQAAARDALAFRGHFQHPVGMTVHDVGTVRGIKLREGMVFTIDPMVWLHQERLYIRIEDVALVTADGVENLSAFVPSDVGEIERTIASPGLVELRPATTAADRH